MLKEENDKLNVEIVNWRDTIDWLVGTNVQNVVHNRIMIIWMVTKEYPYVNMLRDLLTLPDNIYCVFL